MNTDKNINRQLPDRGYRGIFRGAFNIIIPPVAGKYHQRYRQRASLMYLDTILTLIMIFLVGLVILLRVNDTTLPVAAMTATINNSDQIANGELASIKIELKNNGSVNIDSLDIELTPPEGFIYQKAQLSPVGAADKQEINLNNDGGDTYKWHLPEMTIGQDNEFVLFGAYLGNDGDMRDIRFLITGQAGPDKLIKSLSTKVAIQGKLPIVTTLAGTTEAKSGDVISITVRVQNNMAVALTSGGLDVQIPRGFTASSFEPSPKAAPATWDIPTIDPGAAWTATINGKCNSTKKLNLLFASQVSIKQGDQQYFQNGSSHAIVISPVSVKPDRPDQPGPNENKLQFAAEAHYYSTTGVQFGYGPLPPKVGQTTGYRIFWILKNNNKAYHGVTVEAVLPAAVTWASNGSVSLGQPLHYDEASRKVSWQIGELSGNNQYVTASFEVTITPTPADAGKAPRLCNEAVVADHTGATIINITTFPPLSTLVSENQSAGKGLVQK